MRFEDFKKEVEHMLLFQLTLNIKRWKISLEEGKEIASLYLKLQPENESELVHSLSEIGNTHPVVYPVVEKFAHVLDVNETAKRLEEVHTNFQDTFSAVKGGTA